MSSRQIRYQAWASIAAGAIFFAVWIAFSGMGDNASNQDGGGLVIACLAFVGIGALGLTTARGVAALEERLSRLEQSGTETGSGMSRR